MKYLMLIIVCLAGSFVAHTYLPIDLRFIAGGATMAVALVIITGR